MNTTRRRRRPCRVARTAGGGRREDPERRPAVVRLTLTSAVLIGAIAGCAIAIEPLVREVLDALVALADGWGWSLW